MPNFVKDTRHFGIAVKDMEKSLHFYRDLLGLEIIREMDESGNYIDNMLDLEDVKVKTIKLSANKGVTLVELLEFRSHSSQSQCREIFDFGASHVAFTVSDKQGGLHYSDLQAHAGYTCKSSRQVNQSRTEYVIS